MTAHSDEHREWLAGPTELPPKLTPEEEEALWVPPSLEAVIQKHSLSRATTRALVVVGCVDLLSAACGWLAITQCGEQDARGSRAHSPAARASDSAASLQSARAGIVAALAAMV